MAKQEERCRLGLCYNCDEKYTCDHNKFYQCLCLLDAAVEDDDTEDRDTAVTDMEEEKPSYSLQAVVCVRVRNTL